MVYFSFTMLQYELLKQRGALESLDIQARHASPRCYDGVILKEGNVIVHMNATWHNMGKKIK